MVMKKSEQVVPPSRPLASPLASGEYDPSGPCQSIRRVALPAQQEIETNLVRNQLAKEQVEYQVGGQIGGVALPSSPATRMMRLPKSAGHPDPNEMHVENNCCAQTKCEPVAPIETTSPTNAWKEAIIEACVVNHISWDENDAIKSLANLISWEVQVALDPKVSKAAQDLIDRGTATPVETRHDDFDNADHPFRKWWEEHGQFMLAGGGRRESIWAARGWIAREQLGFGVEVTGDSLKERAQTATPVETASGWRCFHCDEVFTDEAEAKEHFGADNFCMPEVPGCIDPLRHDEKARLKELADAREHAMKMQAESEKNDEAEGLLEQFRAEIGRLFGECGGVTASTPHQAWLKLEAAQNLAEAERLRTAELESQLTQARSEFTEVYCAKELAEDRLTQVREDSRLFRAKMIEVGRKADEEITRLRSASELGQEQMRTLNEEMAQLRKQCIKLRDELGKAEAENKRLKEALDGLLKHPMRVRARNEAEAALHSSTNKGNNG